MKTLIRTVATLGVLTVCAVGVAQAADFTQMEVIGLEGVEELQIGDQVPPLSLSDTSGEVYDLADNTDNAHLMVFWSIFCEPCKEEMPIIQRLHEEYGPKGLDVLAVAMDGEDMRTSLKWLAKQQGYTFRILLDELDEEESFVAADPYGVGGTPTIYVLKPGGTVVFAHVGRVSEASLRAAVESALK